MKEVFDRSLKRVSVERETSLLLARCCQALNGVELLLRGAPRCPIVVCFGFLDQKVVCCVFVPVDHLSLLLSQPNNCAGHTVRRQNC